MSDPRGREGSPSQRERSVTERIRERPAFSLQEVRQVKARALGYRFVAGALTSLAAGAVSLGLGARVAGILLAFPSILAASLTLIESEEGGAAAREDARGAILGGLAMALFAAVGALAFESISGALGLALAALAWLLAAVSGYALLWL